MDWNNFNTGRNPNVFNYNEGDDNEQGNFDQADQPNMNYFQPGNSRENIQTDKVPVENRDNYYDILQICKSADIQEIKKAYRKQSLMWHPDKNAECKEEAEERFKLISEAFQTLSDDVKRRAYDNNGLIPVSVAGRSEFDGQGYPDPFGPAAVFASPFMLFDQMFPEFSFNHGPHFHNVFPANDVFLGGFPQMVSPFNMNAFPSPFGMLNHNGNAPMFPSFHNPVFPPSQHRVPVMSQSSFASNNYGGDTVIKTTTFINGRSATIIETNDSKGNIKREITYS